MDESSDDFVAASVPHALDYVGAIGALVPLFVSFSSSSTTTVNGEVVASRHQDYVALGGGSLALVCGLATLTLLGSTLSSDKPKRYLATAVLLLLGAHQVVFRSGFVM